MDVFNKHLEMEKYSRMVPVTEIVSNEYNLNIPRYIDSQEEEDIQDIEAHLLGDIPNTDIDALHPYWEVYPNMRKTLFTAGKRSNYSKLLIAHDTIKSTIFSHQEFTAYSKKVDTVFSRWKARNTPKLKGIAVDDKPKKLIHEISEDLLQAFSSLKLIDKYDVYQHLMVYWSETMQDDVYALVSDGWEAGKEIERDKKQWEGRLIPKGLIIARYFAAEQKAMEELESGRDAIVRQMEEMEEEHGGEEGLMADAKNDKDKITRASVQKRVKELTMDNGQLITEDEEELKILKLYLKLAEQEAEAGKKIRDAQGALEKKILEKYKTLTEAEIKTLIVDDKWISTLERDVKTEMERISQRLTGRIKELAERYETPLPAITAEVDALEKKVHGHLKKMGYVWE